MCMTSTRHPTNLALELTQSNNLKIHRLATELYYVCIVLATGSSRLLHPHAFITQSRGSRAASPMPSTREGFQSWNPDGFEAALTLLLKKTLLLRFVCGCSLPLRSSTTIEAFHGDAVATRRGDSHLKEDVMVCRLWPQLQLDRGYPGERPLLVIHASREGQEAGTVGDVDGDAVGIPEGVQSILVFTCAWLVN
jgi:hypothetical protein